MATTDTDERDLERLNCTALTGSACDPGTVKADPIKTYPPLTRRELAALKGANHE